MGRVHPPRPFGVTGVDGRGEKGAGAGGQDCRDLQPVSSSALAVPGCWMLEIILTVPLTG